MKAFLYRCYFLYYKYWPIQRGKTFLGRQLYKLLGNAVFKLDIGNFELHPLSLIDRMVLEDGNYESDVFEILKNALTPTGGILLDIGANFGLFTVQAAKLPDIFVFSFEPSRRELVRLYKNIALNNLTNVTVFPFGLSEKNYTAELNVANEDNVGMNSIFLNSFSTTLKEKIECYAFDNLLHSSMYDRIKAIKMDVEGFEYKVLLGMNEFLNYYQGPIVLEVTYYLENKIDDYNPDLIYDFLESKGFKPKHGKRYASQYNDVFIKNQL